MAKINERDVRIVVLCLNNSPTHDITITTTTSHHTFQKRERLTEANTNECKQKQKSSGEEGIKCFMCLCLVPLLEYRQQHSFEADPCGCKRTQNKRITFGDIERDQSIGSIDEQCLLLPKWNQHFRTYFGVNRYCSKFGMPINFLHSVPPAQTLFSFPL